MNKGLYDSSFEHDNCGIGAVVNIKGVKTHMTVSNALKIVKALPNNHILFIPDDNDTVDGAECAGVCGDGIDRGAAA